MQICFIVLTTCVSSRSWCAPCRQLGPILHNLVDGYQGKVRLALVNVDEANAVAEHLSVTSIPLVMAFRDGAPVSHFVGGLPAPAVKKFIDQLLPPPQ